MDPLTHTLVGASLAAAGLKRKAALATATLILAANLPDVDGLCQLIGTDVGLAGRRGITHGAAALVVLPLALATIMFFVGKRLERRQLEPPRETQPPIGDQPLHARPALSFRWLLVLSALGVATHPLLDWMNNYGVRLLMPFSPRWFYGDALFIIDPLMWLMAGAAVVFTWGRTKLAALAWVALLLATTAIVVVPKLTPPPAKMLWCVGAGLLVFLRVRGKSPPGQPTAILCLSLLTAYMAAMIWGSAHARSQTMAWLQRQGGQPKLLVAMPLPAQPHRRQVIAELNGGYHYFETSAFTDQAPKPRGVPLAKGEVTAEVQAAMGAPQVQGFMKWLRLPAFSQRKTDSGFQVTIVDARYAGSANARLGRAVVNLDHNLRVIGPEP